jgi:hypothetical protein
MTIKEAVANSLLMFVAASCVVLIVRALPRSSQRAEVSAATSMGSGESTTATTADLKDGVQVYYLHGNFRCPTCRTIEAYAKEAVESGFGDELKSGKLRWQVVNYESPGNEHFAKEYQIVAPSVVLAKLENGKQIDWKALPEVWDLYRNKTEFISLVQTNLREFVTGVPATPGGRPAGESPPALTPEPLPIPE